MQFTIIWFVRFENLRKDFGNGSVKLFGYMLFQKLVYLFYYGILQRRTKLWEKMIHQCVKSAKLINWWNKLLKLFKLQLNISFPRTVVANLLP